MLKQKQTGFTLVELVIVIVLLGLLAATALPRFLNVTDDAQSASLEGVAGGFTTGLLLVHAQWVAEGNSQPGAAAGVEVVMDGATIYVNENGWPAKTNNANNSSTTDMNDARCQQVWEGILQSAPSSVAGNGAIDNERFVISANGGSACTYALVINGAESADYLFEYDVVTGTVTVTLP